MASWLTSKAAGSASFLTASQKNDSSSDKKPVAVQPHELSTATRLPNGRRLLGRVVDVQESDSLFTCYLVCGPTRKQVIQIEAWRELKKPAAQHTKSADAFQIYGWDWLGSKAPRETRKKRKRVHM